MNRPSLYSLERLKADINKTDAYKRTFYNQVIDTYILSLCAQYGEEKTMKYSCQDLNIPWLFLLRQIELDVNSAVNELMNIVQVKICSKRAY